MSLVLEKYSIGMGDRFGRQGKAQLDAVIQARAAGIDLVPVWNKSFREHSIIGTAPPDVRKEADAAVKAGGFKANYYVDADHISLDNVEGFLEVSDFFTIDVADCIGNARIGETLDAFVKRHSDLAGSHRDPGYRPAPQDRPRCPASGRLEVPRGRPAGRPDLPTHRLPQGRGPVRDRGLDG